MRKTKLLSTVAMALLLGASAASAQGMGKEPPERAPAAQQSAPAEKVGPSIKAGEQKSPQTAPAPGSEATGKGRETTGQSPKSQATDKPGATEQNRSTTTGQGAAAGSAKLSTEQRTKITSIIKQRKVEPTKLNVSISVGTRVPARVHLYPLPVEVVAVYPAWRGYEYILVGDQIVVINPRSHEIVAIIEA